jgi:hypothetical protein
MCIERNEGGYFRQLLRVSYTPTRRRGAFDSVRFVWEEGRTNCNNG